MPAAKNQLIANKTAAKKPAAKATVKKTTKKQYINAIGLRLVLPAQSDKSYYKIINHFSSDHALYVDERIVNKYYSTHHQPASLAVFKQTLITK